MKTSLNKLNRVIAKLKEQSKRLSLPASSVSGTYASTSLQEDVVSDLEAKKAEVLLQHAKYCEVHEDIAKLSRLKRKTNEACGVSAILDAIELNKKLMAHYRSTDDRHDIYGTNGATFTSETLGRNVEAALAKVAAGEANPLASRYTPSQMQVSLEVYTSPQLEMQAKALQRGITKLDDQLLELNASTEVEFELSETSKDILGILPDAAEA